MGVHDKTHDWTFEKHKDSTREVCAKCNSLKVPRIKPCKGFKSVGPWFEIGERGEKPEHITEACFPEPFDGRVWDSNGLPRWAACISPCCTQDPETIHFIWTLVFKNDQGNRLSGSERTREAARQKALETLQVLGWRLYEPGSKFTMPRGTIHECCLCDVRYRTGIDEVRCPHGPPDTHPCPNCNDMTYEADLCHACKVLRDDP